MTLRMVIGGVPHVLVEEKALRALLKVAGEFLRTYDEQRARILAFKRENRNAARRKRGPRR